MEPISHYAVRIGNQQDTLWKNRKSLLISCLRSLSASDIFEDEVHLRQQRTGFLQGQVSCACLSLPVVARHMVLTVSVERCPESTSLTSLLCLLPGQTLICSKLLANALSPSWGLSHQSSSTMTDMICLYSRGPSTAEGLSKCLLDGWVNKCKWVKSCTKASELS